MKKPYSNIKSISSNSLKHLTEDRCLICNNKLNYNDGEVFNIYTNTPIVSITCKKCGAVHTAEYECYHNILLLHEKDAYTKVNVKNGKMNIRFFSRYTDEIEGNYSMYCKNIDATIPDEEKEEEL